MAEFHVHGGRAVVAAVISALQGLRGFRPAEAGEFTRRAFLNGRLDLTEVEGLGDLIQAETEAQRRQAMRQAGGTLRTLYDGWRDRLVRARALIEAELDFAEEEDVPGSVSDAAWSMAAAVEEEMAAHLDDGHRGERLRDGAEIVLLGPPNSGKSSLLNALSKRDAAIVTAEPGTTRDLIEVHLDLDGYPLTLIDTAGLRQAAGEVEQEGIRRAGARAKAADLILWLGDVAEPPAPPPKDLEDQRLVRLGTKIDRIDSEGKRSRLSRDFDLLVSVKTGQGIEALLERLAVFVAAEFAPGESVVMTRARHRIALTVGRKALEAARKASGQPLELRAEELRRAADALGRITGRIGVEDLLDVIFRDFCIGK